MQLLTIVLSRPPAFEEDRQLHQDVAFLFSFLPQCNIITSGVKMEVEIRMIETFRRRGIANAALQAVWRQSSVEGEKVVAIVGCRYRCRGIVSESESFSVVAA